MYKYQNRGLDLTASLEGISQITLEKEDSEKFEFMDSTLELQKRLQELEDITLSFLTERPLSLTVLSDAFADIDSQETQEFEFYIPHFTRNDVLCLDIVCLADSVDYNLQSSSHLPSKKTCHEPLEVYLKAFEEESQKYLPSYYNGEYEFVLTSAHGMKSGHFLVVVKNVGYSPQSVRAHLAVCPYVNATTLVSGETLYRRNPSRKAEFAYFRFLLQDPTHLLSIRVNSLRSETGEESDPDIYVSNKYCGLVKVDRDNYTWRSVMRGSDQIDIHPHFDVRAGRSQTFLIGVIGQNELFQDFSISITSVSPPPIVPLLPSEYSRDITIYTEKYSYFSVPVDPLIEGKILITIDPIKVDHSAVVVQQELNDVCQLTQQLGRMLYTEDSLLSSGLCLCHQHSGSVRTLTINDSNPKNFHSSLTTVYLDRSIPPSLSKSKGVFPVGFFSDHSLYPSSEFYVWRGSSLTGGFSVCLETSEWKYSDSKTLYMSLIGAMLPATENSPKSVNCKVTLSLIEDPHIHDETWKSTVQIFNLVFELVDGSAISQQDRSRCGNSSDTSSERIDQQGLTYGEVDFASFLSILHASHSRDNHVFVDLGCGVGKSLVAAALSGIKFMRCIGIELLPGLCQEAKKAVEKLKQCAHTQGLRIPLMEIWEGDFCDPALSSWINADVVFISSLCFPDHVVQKLMALAQRMRPGSVLITLKSPDSYSDAFEVITTGWYKMTWGRVLVFILRRTENSLITGKETSRSTAKGSS